MKDSTEINEMYENLLSLLDRSSMQRTTKWGAPVYTHQGKNIVGVMKFKHYASLWFFNGAFLSDPLQTLTTSSDGKAQNMRHWKFFTKNELQDKHIQEYIFEAMALQEEGKTIQPKKSIAFSVPEELKNAMADDPVLSSAFEKLSKSCQREYSDYIGEAKKAETRTRRLEKVIPMIMDAKGLNDKFRKS